MISIYNSLTRQKEPFQPIHPGKIGMYVCGITVYDRCHLGHARAMVLFDVIVRFFRQQGYDVNFVRNITDIDDKIIRRANELNIAIDALTAQYIEAMHEDAAALYVLPPDLEPRATEHIPTIIQLIQTLIEKGFAYIGENGDVCYEVARFAEYGKLSHKDIEGLQAGARIEVVKEKRSPLDFVLWKLAKLGEPSWPSPWGEGRPGWHIECSAMAMHELSETFDIHGGGQDLQFPHHENEIAQSEAATGQCFAKYWMHVGLLQINQEKMAKSTGNFLTIADVIQQYHPEAVRYFLLSSHYRSALNYSDDQLQMAYSALSRLYAALQCFDWEALSTIEPEEHWVTRFVAAMQDDFNTPIALSVLFELSREVNKTKQPKLAATLKQLAHYLGLLNSQPTEFFKLGVSAEQQEKIQFLIDERSQARLDKNWQRADEIRNQLADQGIELEDTALGTVWRSK